MSLNWGSLCRLCATVSDSNSNIFIQNSRLVELILKYMSISISEGDESSTSAKICSKCEDKVTDFHNFSLQCQRIQAMFETYKKDALVDLMHLQYIKSEFSLDFKIKEEVENDAFEDCTNYLRLRNAKSKLEKGGNAVKKPRGRPRKNVVDKINNHIVNANKVFKNDINISSVAKLSSSEIHRENDIKNEDNAQNSFLDTLKINNLDTESNRNSDQEIDNINDFDIFRFTCHKCKLECSNWESLKLHVEAKHKTSAQITCVCFKILSNIKSLKRHSKKHNPRRCITRLTNRCESCEKTFASKKELKSHVTIHLPRSELPYVCCKCAKRFANPKILAVHEKIHKPREERFLWSCEICEAKFATKGALNSHTKTVHENVRPYMCDLCGHSCSTKANLKQHSASHSTERQFICNSCNKSFKTKTALCRHIDTHGDTAYKCPHCPKLLNSRRTLRNHLYVHDDRASHACPMCGKTFKRKKDIKNHMKLHTGERPYSCPWCSRTFTSGSNCRIHKRRMHPQEFQIAEETNPYAPAIDEKKESPKKVIHTTIKVHPSQMKSYNMADFTQNTKINSNVLSDL